MTKTLLCTSLLVSQLAHADYIETIEVIGSKISLTEVDQVSVTTISEAIQPAMVYIPGGVGAFTGFSERGTQPNHTAVYRNGVPVNDAGAGWYDLGHDLATGNEMTQVVNGPQGVLYGTSSMGGTVFITDSINQGALVKAGSRGSIVSVSPTDTINITYADISNGSVRTDNTEQDHYVQTGIRLQDDFFDDSVRVNVSYQDYDYDYDDCYPSAWTMSNDCVQQGVRTSVSVRSDRLTLGYSSNQSEFFTGTESTYETDAESFYADGRNSFDFGNSSVLVGMTYREDRYIGRSQNFIEPYAFVNVNDVLDAGIRVTDGAVTVRAGAQYADFFASVSTSYRVPTLYEVYGDGVWVLENQNLDSEQGVGYEVGYKGVSVYRYEFIEGIDYNFATSSYSNTGEYVTQGVRALGSGKIGSGEISYMVGYTDTERLRVPKYKGSVIYTHQLGAWQLKAQFVAQYDRGSDAVYFGGPQVQLEDVNTLDLFVTKQFANHTISMGWEDVFNDSMEIIPGYSAGGQQFTLTWQYK